jgi:hypothetical protein
MFAAIFPPDPSILQNYAALREGLRPERAKRYRSLLIAVAVAKRTKGIESVPEVAQVGRVYQPGFWVDESLHKPANDGERGVIQGIAEYMKATGTAALDLYRDSARQRDLVGFLLRHHVALNVIGEVKQSVGFGERLKNAMVLLGQRPAARDEKPNTRAWLDHVVSIYEAAPPSTPSGMSWPLFPIDRAPWPLLMPLSRPVPLSEAQYVWEAFQGEHGADRYHTYGPYRGDADVMPDELKPSRWFWDAWPDQVVHGGMCVPISKATTDLYSCLDKPAMWCGQPGHANLISFQCVGGLWTAEIEQAFAGGPDVSFAQWYFDDSPAYAIRSRDLYLWPGAEYQLGLALGMNVGLSSYVDGRIAEHVFRALPLEKKRAIGVRLLQDALRANPYNPDVWYRLAKYSPNSSADLELLAACQSRRDQKAGGGPKAVKTAMDQYWKTVETFVAQYAIVGQPAPAGEEPRRSVYRLLRSLPGIKPDQLASYAAQFAQRGPAANAAADLKYDQKLADAGDPFGELRMGQRYRDGDGVGRDLAKAKALFAKAAAQGDPAAGEAFEQPSSVVAAKFITVMTSSTFSGQQLPIHLIDGSGMKGLTHDNDGAANTMWHSAERPALTSPAARLPPSPAWVKFEFREPQKIEGLLIWNHNQAGLTDRGFRATRIYGSPDGVTWFPLTPSVVIELPRASGNPSEKPLAVNIAAASRPLRWVVIAAEKNQGNYGGSCYGLSAVRFVLEP